MYLYLGIHIKVLLKPVRQEVVIVVWIIGVQAELVDCRDFSPDTTLSLSLSLSWFKSSA